MIGPITGCWAKLGTDAHGNTIRDPVGTPTSWHPLSHHCADVAAVLMALLEQRIVRRWLAALHGTADLDPIQRQRLGYFAALHDIGKVNLGFQNRRYHPPRRPTAGHVGPLLQLLSQDSVECRRMLAAIHWSDLQGWFANPAVAADLLYTAICHHGRPLEVDSGSSLSLWRSSMELDPLLEAEHLGRAARDWMPLAFDTGSPLKVSAPFQHGFNGLLTLADWIASDTSLFGFADEPDEDRFAWARPHADFVLRRLGLDVSEARSALGAARPTFATIAEGEPRQLQAKLLELPVTSGGSITVLEAETGAGKTEAAIARFIRLFHEQEVDGLYFALPTRTAATQIHRRVHQAICRAYPDEAERPPVVLAVPGYLAVDDVQGVQIARFGVRWPGTSLTWRGKGWAAEHSKRFLAGTIVIGTIDQVLLSALAVSHSHMRAAALARHLLVVDEVHASDAYMTTILEAVLARHLGAGGHALLMSATLGAAARQRLVRPGRFAVPPTPETARAAPYPVVTHAAPVSADPVLIPLTRSVGKCVAVELAKVADSPDQVAGLAWKAAQAGARVLVIRNTVADCIATQTALEGFAADQQAGMLLRCNGAAAPHHSRYSREDRQALDEAIEKRFGKSSPCAGLVAIATQTVQQSLDLDADLLLTDLCPFDVLLQRVGRLHRHSRSRPKGFDSPRLVVVLPEDRNLGRHIRKDGSARGPHGIGSVYSDLRVLEATWLQLERHRKLEVPAMCRELVENTTHPDALAAVAAAGCDAWARHSEWIIGVLLAHCRIAAGHLVNWSSPFADARFPSDGARIGTRLGAEDRLVEFEPPAPAESGPFGNATRRISIPHWLVRNADAEESPRNICFRHSAIEFEFGSERYVYDRLGLRRLSDTSPTTEEDDG
jgi:CRISPR-associated endonuclease/helicase Cas3